MEKTKNRVRFASGTTVEGSSAYETTYVVSRPWAEVQLVAEEPFGGPDTFVLCEAGAEAKAEARFWAEVPAASAERASARVWRLPFTETENEGGKADAFQSLRDFGFDLIHRPGGDAMGQRAVFTERPYDELFNEESNAEGDVRVAARFAPGRFFTAEEAVLPGDARPVKVPEKEESRSRASRNGTSHNGTSGRGTPGNGAAAGDAQYQPPAHAAAPVAQDLRETAPMQEREVETKTSEPAAESGSADSEAGAGSERVRAQHWVYVFAPPEAATSQGERTRARFLGAWKAGTDGQYQQAVYQLKGPVRVERFPDVRDARREQVLIEDLPVGNVIVWTTPLALPTGRVQALEETLGHQFGSDPQPNPLRNRAAARVRPAACAFPVTDMAVFFDQAAARKQKRRHPFWNGSPFMTVYTGGCDVHLADALAVAERRGEEMRVAATDFEDWQPKAFEAIRLGQLVANPCYRTVAPDRTYLQERLASLTEGDDTYSMVQEWNTFITEEEAEDYREGWSWGEKIMAQSPAAMIWEYLTDDPDFWSSDDPRAQAAEDLTDEATNRHLLAQFCYGAGRKEADLKGRWYGRAERLARWLRAPAFDQTLRDIAAVYAAEMQADGALSNETEGAIDRLIGALAGLEKTKPGGAYFAQLFEEAGVAGPMEAFVQAVRSGVDTASAEGDAGGEAADAESADEDAAAENASEPAPAVPASLLDPLEKTKDLGLKALTEAPTFKLLWTLAEKGTGTAFALAEAMRPAVIGYARFARRETSAVICGAFFQRALYRSQAVTLEVTEGRIRIGAGESRMAVYQQTFVNEDGLPVVYKHTGRRVRGWQIDFDRAAIEGRLAGASRVLRATNVVLMIYQVGTAKEGALNVENGIIMMKIVQAVAEEAVEHMQRGGARRLGRELGAEALEEAAKTLPIVGSLLDGVEAAWNTYKEGSETTPQGMQRVPDPDFWSYVSYGVAGLGAVATGALVVVGSGGWAAVVGIVAAVGSFAIDWYAGYQDEQERRAFDPLFTRWLPQASVFGQAYNPSLNSNPQQAGPLGSGSGRGGLNVGAHREALFDLVRRGDAWRTAEVPTREIAEQTKGFVQAAYAFPVTAAYRPPHWEQPGPARTPLGTDERVEGLVLRIAPTYLPATGTLMVDANVQVLNDRGQPVVGSSAEVRCAVHYMWTGEGFRYAAYPLGPDGAAEPVEPELHRVLQGWDTELDEVTVTAERPGREGTEPPGDAPASADTSNAPSSEPEGEESEGDAFRAYAREHWAPSRSYKVEAENAEGNKERREVDGLWIYVGRQWRAWEKAWWAEKTEAERRAHVEKPTSWKRRDYYEMAWQRRLGMADVVKAGAHPAAHLAEVAGLEGALGSGRFEVAGTVFFNPLRAFDPQAKVPSRAAKPEFMAEQQLLYRYPEGAQR